MRKVVLPFCLLFTLHFVAFSSIAATPPNPSEETIPRVRIVSPPWEKGIDIGYKLVIVIIAVGATVTFFWRGVKYLKTLSRTTKKWLAG